MSKILLTFILSLLLSNNLAFGATVEQDTSSSPEKSPPSGSRCADPTLTARYVTAVDAGRTTHTVDQRWLLVNNDAPATAGEWTLQGDNFCAWATAQNSTSPLHLFFNPSTTDYLFVLSPDGTVPNPSGLLSQGVRAYVYATQICGSVPLYTLSKASVGDHWYTIFPNERASLISAGWTDEGIIAYVLPLNNCAFRY